MCQFENNGHKIKKKSLSDQINQGLFAEISVELDFESYHQHTSR